MTENTKNKETSVHQLLANVIQQLKAPKDQSNKMFKSRTASGILEAVKPLIEGAVLTLNDEVQYIGTRYYIKCVAKLELNGESVSATGLSQEGAVKGGLDVAQQTGTASTYSRKRALEGLFAIDDSKGDPDLVDNDDRLKQELSSHVAMIKELQAQLGYSNDQLFKGVSRNINRQVSRLSQLNNGEAQLVVEKLGKQVGLSS